MGEVRGTRVAYVRGKGLAGGGSVTMLWICPWIILQRLCHIRKKPKGRSTPDEPDPRRQIHYTDWYLECPHALPEWEDGTGSVGNEGLSPEHTGHKRDEIHFRDDLDLEKNKLKSVYITR